MDWCRMDGLGTAPLQSAKQDAPPDWKAHNCRSSSNNIRLPSATIMVPLTSFVSKRTRSSRSLLESGDSESSSSVASHRSCLMKQNGMIMKRQRKVRRVQFVDEPVSNKKEIDLVRDSLETTKELKNSHQSDVRSEANSRHIPSYLECNRYIQSYLRTTDAAYIEFVSNSSSRNKSNSNLEQAMIHGVGEGYRALECSSRDARQRNKSRQLVVVSILAKSRLLQTQGAGVASCERQLRKHSKKLSHESRQWAQFLGEIDAAAAAAEYATIPPSLLLVRRRPGVAGVRQKSRRQLAPLIMQDQRGSFLNRVMQRWTSNIDNEDMNAVECYQTSVPAVVVIEIAV